MVQEGKIPAKGFESKKISNDQELRLRSHVSITGLYGLYINQNCVPIINVMSSLNFTSIINSLKCNFNVQSQILHLAPVLALGVLAVVPDLEVPAPVLGIPSL